MKTSNLLFILLCLPLLSLLMSCSEDDMSVQDNLTLEGTEWLKTKLVSVDCGSTIGTSTDFTCTSSDCSSLFFFEGASYEKIVVANSTLFNRGQYDLTATTLQTNIFGANETFDYTISGNILELKQMDNSSGCEFITEYRGREVSDPEQFIQDLLAVNRPLEGTIWLESSAITTECDNPADSGNTACNSGDCDQLILSDGVVTINIFENDLQTGIVTGTYTLDGSRVTFEFDESSGRQGFTANFQIENNQLALVYADDLTGCVTVEIYVGFG